MVSAWATWSRKVNDHRKGPRSHTQGCECESRHQFQGRCANLYSVMSAVRFHPNSVNKCLKRNAFLLRGKFVSLFPNKSVRLCQGSNVLMYQDKNALLYLAKNVALCPDSNVNKYQDNSVLVSQENSAVEVQDKSAHRFLDKTASRCLRSSAPVCQEARIWGATMFWNSSSRMSAGSEASPSSTMPWSSKATVQHSA